MFALIYKGGIIARDYSTKFDALNASKAFRGPVQVIDQNSEQFRLIEDRIRKERMSICG
jgi:hypothetical protein